MVDTHSVRSGYFSFTSARVSKVSSLASGSPGPAMPRTFRLGTFSYTYPILATACSGLRTSLVTPGRDSLLQSNLRLQ